MHSVAPRSPQASSRTACKTQLLNSQPLARGLSEARSGRTGPAAPCLGEAPGRDSLELGALWDPHLASSYPPTAQQRGRRHLVVLLLKRRAALYQQYFLFVRSFFFFSFLSFPFFFSSPPSDPFRLFVYLFIYLFLSHYPSPCVIIVSPAVTSTLCASIARGGGMEGGSGRSPGPGPALALRGTLMAVGGGSRLLAARRGERRSVSSG